MDDPDFRAGSGQTTPQLRKHPRVRVSAPFPCSLARVGLLRKGAVEQGLGIIYDVSAKGARVMTEAVITPETESPCVCDCPIRRPQWLSKPPRFGGVKNTPTE